jgi:hypothetical protein
MTFSRADLVFAPDPFKVGTNPRPWVVISDNGMPFPGDLLCAACTRSDYPMNHELTEDVFESGTKPDQATYCSPWLLATLKPGTLQFKQGTLTEKFTNEIARDAIQYIDTGD